MGPAYPQTGLRCPFRYRWALQAASAPASQAVCGGELAYIALCQGKLYGYAAHAVALGFANYVAGLSLGQIHDLPTSCGCEVSIPAPAMSFPTSELLYHF